MDSGKSASVHGETKNNQYGAGNAFSKIIRNPERGPIRSLLCRHRGHVGVARPG